MKTTQVFLGIIICLLFVGIINAQTIQKEEGKAQELTLVRTNNSIRLNGSSETRELQVEVAEEGCYFNLDIDANVEKGSIKIEIYDPRGRKKGVFSTGTTKDKETSVTLKTEDKGAQKKECTERVSGEIMQQNALSGVWTIKIIPNHTFGVVTFRNQQSSNTQNEKSKSSR